MFTFVYILGLGGSDPPICFLSAIFAWTDVIALCFIGQQITTCLHCVSVSLIMVRDTAEHNGVMSLSYIN